MNPIVALVLGIVIGAVVTYFLMKKGESSDSFGLETSKIKAENKKKIMAFFDSRDQVVNNDIEKLLKVSDATAERYLDELEHDGKLKQVGKTGVKTYYTKK